MCNTMTFIVSVFTKFTKYTYLLIVFYKLFQSILLWNELHALWILDNDGDLKDIRISMDKHQREIRQAKLKSQEFNSRLRDLTIAIRYALGC